MENNKEFILKLFEQVKQSSDKTDAKIDSLNAIVKELVMSSSKPSHDDIMESIEKLDDCIDNVSRNAEGRKINIDDCKKDIHDAKEIIITVAKKINTMIITIIVAFALMTAAYMFVSTSVESIVHKEMEKTYVVDKELKSKLEVLLGEIPGETKKTSNK
jgi:proline dehydrogenase